jgi:hypothetical protein
VAIPAAKAEIILPKAPGVPLNAVDVATDRAAIADKGLVENCPSFNVSVRTMAPIWT